MKEYLDLLRKVHEQGVYREPARESMPGSQNLFGEMIEIDLRKGFPLLTTKKMAWNAIVTELLWFLRGEPNLRYLWKYNVHIWDQDAYRFYKRRSEQAGVKDSLILSFPEWLKKLDRMRNGAYWERNGDFDKMTFMGAVYPVQWRGTFIFGAPAHSDQINYMIQNIRNNPLSRYHIVSAWNPMDIQLNQDTPIMALPCCHMSHQILVDKDTKEFDMLMYQRSADIFLGVPFNIASYALLCRFYGMMTGYKPRYLKMIFGSVDLYETHFSQARIQLSRDYRQLPKIEIYLDEGRLSIHHDMVEKYNITGKSEDLTNIIKCHKPHDFRLIGYEPHTAIKGKLDTGLGI